VEAHNLKVNFEKVIFHENSRNQERDFSLNSSGKGAKKLSSEIPKKEQKLNL